jgi:hypothetical protein
MRELDLDFIGIQETKLKKFTSGLLDDLGKTNSSTGIVYLLKGCWGHPFWSEQ